MNSIRWSHPLRIARPLGLLSRTNPYLLPTQSCRISPLRHGRQPGTRSVHFGPAIASVLQEAQSAIINVHSITHLPWFLMIPCIAIGISLVFRFPLNAYPHRITQRRTKFFAVLQAWSWRIQKDVQQEKVPSAQRKKEITSRHKKTARRIYRTAGLQQWRLFANILGFPFWILGIDSVRRICGGPRGVAGYFLTGVSEDTDAASSTQGDAQATTSPTDVTTTVADQVSTVASDTSTASTIAENAKNLPDPSIALEGCLWFPDLTAADPYQILPSALSLLLVVNMLPKSRAGMRRLFGLKTEDQPEPSERTMRQLRFRRGLIFFSSFVGPLTANLPAALHLYWLSTASTHLVTGRVLSYLMPISSGSVERCKGTEVVFAIPKPDMDSAPQTKQKDIQKRGSRT